MSKFSNLPDSRMRRTLTLQEGGWCTRCTTQESIKNRTARKLFIKLLCKVCRDAANAKRQAQYQASKSMLKEREKLGM